MKKEFYEIELRINSILFWISVMVTITAMATMVIAFFSRGAFPPTGIGIFYVGVLFIYSSHKEAMRWMEKKDIERGMRRGEYFVYAWVILTTILYLINFFTKDLYRFDDNGEKLEALSEVTATALEVGTVFIVTRIVKTIFSIWIRQKN